MNKTIDIDALEDQVRELKQANSLLADENKNLLEQNNFNDQGNRLACLNEAVQWSIKTTQNNPLTIAKEFYDFIKTGAIKSDNS